MAKHVNAGNIHDQYEIHEEGGKRFIFAQPNGEKIIVHEKPSWAKIVPVALGASAALVAGLVVWLTHFR